MSSILPPGVNDLISIFVCLPLSWPPHLRQPYHTPSNPLQLVQQYLQLSFGIQRSNIPCAHAHLFSPMKQVLFMPTTGFSLVYDLQWVALLSPPLPDADPPPLRKVAPLTSLPTFFIRIHHHVRVSWSLARW